MKTDYHMHRRRKISFLLFLSSLLVLLPTLIVQAQTPVVITDPEDPIAPLPWPTATPTPTPSTACTRTIKASVVALDQAIMYNRLGAVNPGGMIYALKQDVVAIDAAKGLGWKPISPVKAGASAGSELTIGTDGTVTAGGPVPAFETYEVTFTAP